MSFSSQLYVGCYTKGDGGDGTGLLHGRRDPGSGALIPEDVVASHSPSYVVRHPSLPVLYAVNELEHGQITVFDVAVDPEPGRSPVAREGSRVLVAGEPRVLGTWNSGGALPCHLAVDPGQEYLFVANYGSGSVAVFALDGAGRPTHRSDHVRHRAADGHSGHGVHPVRQAAPHAHHVFPAPDGLFAVDLGNDAVYRYAFDRATGRLGAGEVALRLPPGTGPRHLSRVDDRFHLVGELDGSVTTFERTPTGWSQSSQVAASVRPGAVPSEIAASADGRFLYVANRVVDTIAVFALGDGPPQRLGEVPTGGVWPRHFALVDGFLYVANERSHSVVVFRVDEVTGLPVPTGDQLSTPSPTCVLPY